VDYIADLTVSNKDFEVIKHDLSTTYINMSLKAHKLNQLVKTSSIRLAPIAGILFISYVTPDVQIISLYSFAFKIVAKRLSHIYHNKCSVVKIKNTCCYLATCAFL